ncbi:MAG TPA: HAD family hydrolase [Thermoplasmata archaeon]|jgi:HAD superfamily hydrolase (TIGR01509 family)|nr:HAD family hydrolase [Thermoplasmata archaeon]
MGPVSAPAAPTGIRAILLDYGGTLVSGTPDPYPVWAPVLAARGLSLDRAGWEGANDRALARLGHLMYRTVGERPTFWDRVHAATLEELGVADPGGAIVAALHDAATSPTERPPFPETEAVLRELRGLGLSLHVVSNSTDYLVEAIDRLGWRDRFDSLTYSQEAGAEKPDRRVFELALRRAGVPPGAALHVGDTWGADYEGARAAGLNAAWLSRDGRAPPEPATTVRDLTGIRALLGR